MVNRMELLIEVEEGIQEIDEVVPQLSRRSRRANSMEQFPDKKKKCININIISE